LNSIQEVRGSIPLSSTNKDKGLRVFTASPFSLKSPISHHRDCIYEGLLWLRKGIVGLLRRSNWANGVQYSKINERRGRNNQLRDLLQCQIAVWGKSVDGFWAGQV